MMNINELISTLPSSVLSGNNIKLPDNVIRRMFKLAHLDKNDIFYDLGCGNSDALYIASIEYKVKKAIGIEKRKTAVREIIEKMIGKFSTELKDGSRIISIWSPPGLIMPDKINFPFFVSRTPFKFAKSIEAQIEVVYGQKCLDFTAAWLLG